MTSWKANGTGGTCPTCGIDMTLAATTPHAMDARMTRRTYVCARCNLTRTYMLPTEDAPSVVGPSGASDQV
jgi:hypothetical protein